MDKSLPLGNNSWISRYQNEALTGTRSMLRNMGSIDDTSLYHKLGNTEDRDFQDDIDSKIAQYQNAANTCFELIPDTSTRVLIMLDKYRPKVLKGYRMKIENMETLIRENADSLYKITWSRKILRMYKFQELCHMLVHESITFEIHGRINSILATGQIMSTGKFSNIGK